MKNNEVKPHDLAVPLLVEAYLENHVDSSSTTMQKHNTMSNQCSGIDSMGTMASLEPIKFQKRADKYYFSSLNDDQFF